MEHLLFFLYIIILSTLFAKIEIEIEGKFGWAEKLPTWKTSPDHWFSKNFLNSRPLTGYHVWIVLFMFFMIHFIYLFVGFTLILELKLLSFFILFWMFEDFLWFLLNPNYGLANFKPEKIWWHKKHWWLIAPRDYFIFIPLGIILYILSFYI
ncbi:MAG: hypothetical protein ABID45_02730 [Patescibacteria group bacterium]